MKRKVTKRNLHFHHT